MAARENQGYLIAVIILVLLSLALALVAFLGVQSAYENDDASQAAEKKLEVSRAIAEAQTLKGQALKAMIGDLGPAASEIDKVINDLGQITARPSLAEGDKALINEIIEEVRTAQEIYRIGVGGVINNTGDDDVALATLRSRITSLSTLVSKMRKDYTIQVRQTDQAASDAKEKIDKAREDLKSALEQQDNLTKQLATKEAEYIVNKNKLQAEVDEGSKAISELTRKSEEAAQIASAALLESKNQVALLEVDKANLKSALDQFTNQVFDHPDGKVIRVASALDVVFIDKGSNDGLTNNRKFSIYDQSVTNFETAKSKASIEVVSVGPFRSEARITEENPVDPILRGDYILTPVWDPGFRLKIALAGRFDLDGDRYDDTEKLIRLVERNGGDVVARHDDKGKITGKISPEVRYLVRGNEPLIDGGEEDVNAGKILTALRELEDEAKKNSVQVIDLQKLLNRMGVSAQPKTKQLDFPPGGFVPRQPGTIQESGSTDSSETE